MTPQMGPVRIQFKPINQPILANGIHHGAEGAGRRFTQTLWQALAGGGCADWMTDVAPIWRCLGHSWRLWPPVLVPTLGDLNGTGAWDRPAPLTKRNETPPYYV